MQDAADPVTPPDPAATPTNGAPSAKRRFGWGRIVPLAVLVAGLVAFFAFGLNDYVSFELLAAGSWWLASCTAAMGLGAATRRP